MPLPYLTNNTITLNIYNISRLCSKTSHVSKRSIIITSEDDGRNHSDNQFRFIVQVLIQKNYIRSCFMTFVSNINIYCFHWSYFFIWNQLKHWYELLIWFSTIRLLVIVCHHRITVVVLKSGAKSLLAPSNYFSATIDGA